MIFEEKASVQEEYDIWKQKLFWLEVTVFFKTNFLELDQKLTEIYPEHGRFKF